MSLRVKVMLGVLISLAVIMGIFGYLQYNAERELMLHMATQTATDLGNVIEGSLAEAMLAQDFSTVQDSMDNVVANAQVRELLLLNNASEIRAAAPRASRVGRQLSKLDEGCKQCHAPNAPHRGQYSVILPVPSEGRILRNCNPIENRPACYRCHDASNRYNGVLITDVSMDVVDQHFAEDRRNYLFFYSTGLIAAAVVVSLAMHTLVVGRLERFIDVIDAFRQGDFGRRINSESRDEVGQLADALDAMARGMEEKAGLEEELRERTRELEALYEALQEKEARRRELLAKTISAQEEERKRLSRELHDELAQALTALTMRLEALEERIPPEYEALTQQVIQTRRLTVQTLEETRRLILDLRPTMLDDLGLVPAIRWYVETHLESRGVTVSLETRGEQRRLASTIETALFRIVQEAVNNVARHAQATQAEIHLTFDDSIVVVVADDGVGFDLDAVLAGGDATRGMGLLGIQERVDLLGGTLTIDTAPGAATRVTVEVPAGEVG